MRLPKLPVLCLRLGGNWRLYPPQPCMAYDPDNPKRGWFTDLQFWNASLYQETQHGPEEGYDLTFDTMHGKARVRFSRLRKNWWKE